MDSHFVRLFGIASQASRNDKMTVKAEADAIGFWPVPNVTLGEGAGIFDYLLVSLANISS